MIKGIDVTLYERTQTGETTLGRLCTAKRR